MRAVVEADVVQVRRCRGADRGGGAGVHEHVAVAVEHEDPTVGAGERHAEADRGGEAHRADHIKAFLAVARGAAGARDVAVGVDADGPRGNARSEKRECVGEGHAKSPGRMTSATGVRRSRISEAAQATSASTVSGTGARCGMPKTSS